MTSEADDKPSFEKSSDPEKPRFELTSPWGTDAGATMEFSADALIKARTKLHVEALKEGEKTKRLSLVLAAVMVVASLLAVLFAPAGREVVSYWIGATLLVSAAGAAGYKRVWGKSKLMSFGGDEDKLPAQET
jgi:hypothetical protein